ncbi:MAG: NlpC/P60 family protein [Flavobacteriales bacterium]|nr:NlpC/P60 family protein [Flavobacteriales bacterium]MCW8912596.1 NlpC/P60 family protein [Flavobacteriales bacterium]MCW8938201.1 NlpC/P60 family protein [Flavobacteriales bacterium]MCW8940583.1 NlpC/P60 family protein [Flavobacteriales bacterium]MCW8967007.1 NlpC/P60 family protein [Flavobacteriales bacterium]
MHSSQQQYRLYLLLAVFVLWSCKTTQLLPDKNKTATKNNTPPVNVVFDELEESDVKKEEVSATEPTLPKEALELKTKYAELLEASPKELEHIELYAFVDEWVGVKYKYGGTTKKGVDCSGFTNLLYNNVFKKELPRSSSDIAAVAKSISKKELSEGDFVFFSIRSNKVDHVGIYLANNRFVHASTSKGVIISSLEHPYYAKYFKKGGRLE